MKINYSYLNEQFKNPDPILDDIKKLISSGDFTLGYPLTEFENNIKDYLGVKHAVGVGTGTDALFLILKALEITNGDEVITAANTFFATIGAIAATGAKPVFVDSDNSFNIDPEKIERAITTKTKAIMPVHYMGLPVNLNPIMEISKKHDLPVIEDSCQALGGKVDNKFVGTIGIAGGFSFHPLKNLNVWGDAGMIVTNSDTLYEKLILLRNHGLKNRDEMEIFGYNSRLDSLQAVVGNHLFKSFPEITENKIKNANLCNSELVELSDVITLPKVPSHIKHVYHLYMFLAEDRDNLLKHLQDNGIDAKVHYPIPLHLQNACRALGYKKGDFPVYEKQCEHYITLPMHQHLNAEQVMYMVNKIKEFYKKN